MTAAVPARVVPSAATVRRCRQGRRQEPPARRGDPSANRERPT
jgi:hypothetical protein